jgi:hypothetical protein
MNHTPGPWSFHEASRSNEFVIRDHGSSGGYAPIAIVKGDKRSTLAQSAANARLISAAPFLLEALAEMLVHCQDEERNDDIARAVYKARAAILKATGETK